MLVKAPSSVDERARFLIAAYADAQVGIRLAETVKEERLRALLSSEQLTTYLRILSDYEHDLADATGQAEGAKEQLRELMLESGPGAKLSTEVGTACSYERVSFKATDVDLIIQQEWPDVNSLVAALKSIRAITPVVSVTWRIPG